MSNTASSSDTRQISDIDYREIEFLSFIDGGNFASVYLANWRGRKVAVKKYTQQNHMPCFDAEAEQLSRVCHPNIIILYAKSSAAGILVMEYSSIGALSNVIDGIGKYDYTAAHAISWARQAANGIAHLHLNKVVHRDLKPANMLLFKEGQLLKLTDFGTATGAERTYLTSDRGSPAWMAPEVWHTNDYNEKCDVYSWAIYFWQLLTRRQPFKGCGAYEVMWRVLHGGRLPLLENCPSVIHKIITDCWDGEKTKRPPMNEVANKIEILQKLYPGKDDPITIHQETTVVESPKQPEKTLKKLSSLETPIFINTNTCQDDLGSLAVTSISRENLNNKTSSLNDLQSASYQQDRVRSAVFQEPKVPSRPPPQPPRPSSETPESLPRRPPVVPPRPTRLAASPPIFNEIREHLSRLSQAELRARSKVISLTHIKLQKESELDALRSEQANAKERVMEYQRIAAENEELQGVVSYLEDQRWRP